MWGYKPILDTDADEKKVLNQWITERADDLMFRFGSSSIDPSSQTEDLGNVQLRPVIME